MEKIDAAEENLADTEIEVKKRAVYEIERDLVIRLDIAEALKTLTAKQRQCFQLLAEGYTFREIASQLALSLPTVQQHITSAKKKLKYFLADTIQNP